jgi:polyisoprenyl-phosphate glycosyltransferase
MTVAGISLVVLTGLMALLQIIGRLLFPELTPRGVTTTLLFIMFFGSLNFLGLSVLGEYLAKVFEEVKRRPHFIRRSVIRDGEIRHSDEERLTTVRG